ncbi:peptidase [Foetidibacter luteolus]|uniref:peptidase n=1 Tax=Foetidibacter luteolus TaxID=2608880 RepID=UPI00129B6BA6|nr:peptidase [Foetidibacter luteolus]
MTYCLGIKLKEGLVGISDTRISAGTSTTIKKKVSVHQDGQASLFIMTSGLRSVRDKAVHYFQELVSGGIIYDKMYMAVNAFGEQIKRVANEDNEALLKSGYRFNLNAIVGGQLKKDEEHKLFLLYSEGNWVELDQGCPYVIIGNSGQGKAILNRVVNENTSIRQALKAGYLSFDSTRVSSNDVEFPIDVVLYQKNSFNMVETRYEYSDLENISRLWAEKLRKSLDEIPEDWMEAALNKM